MKITLYIIILMLLSITPAFAGSWDKQNTKLHIPLTALFIADMQQTLQTAREPERYHENNPILGKHPSEGEVYTYFVGTYVLITALTYVMPLKWSRRLQIGVIAVEGVAVLGNLSIGLRVGF